MALEKKLARATRDAGARADHEPHGGFPDYVSFTAPSSALTVKQHEDGSLSVQNRDPELALKVVLVEARRADGTVDKIPVAIPPVGK